MRNFLKTFVVIAAAVLVMWGGLPAAAQEARVVATLLSDTRVATPGSTIRLGVRFDILPKSHIYWKNPGGSGLSTTIDWTLPEECEAGELLWPAPRSFEVEGLNEVFYGYEEETLLFANITIPKDASEKIIIAAEVTWLLCLDDGVCIPGSDELSLDVKVGAETVTTPSAETFDYFSEQVPTSAADAELNLDAKWDTRIGELHITIPDSLRVIREYKGREVAWFPESGSGWKVDILDPKNLAIRSKYRPQEPGPGVLVLPLANAQNTTRTYIVRFPGPTAP